MTVQSNLLSLNRVPLSSTQIISVQHISSTPKTPQLAYIELIFVSFFVLNGGVPGVELRGCRTEGDRFKSYFLQWLLRPSTRHYAIFSWQCDRNWNDWKRDSFSGADFSWICFWSMWRLNHLRNGPVWHSNQFWRFEFCNSGDLCREFFITQACGWPPVVSMKTKSH